MRTGPRNGIGPPSRRYPLSGSGFRRRTPPVGIKVSVGLHTLQLLPPAREVATGDPSFDRAFVARLSRSGLGRSSIARKLSVVRSFLSHAVRVGRIEANPAAKKDESDD